MSNDTARKTKRMMRRSIPVLIPKETGKRGTNLSMTSVIEKPSPTATGSGDGGGTTSKTKTKHTPPEKTISSFREKTDDHPKSRPPLSLQGPFNPNIVGHRRNDEQKRKRHPVLKSGNGTVTDKNPPSTIQAPKVELFSNIKFEHEDHKPKRNPTQDKKRCSIEFQHKPETNFAENTEKAITFSAAGKTVNKPPSKHTRHVDSWRSDRNMREKVQTLEHEKSQLTEDYQRALDEMERILWNEMREKAHLQTEKHSLEEKLNETDTINSAAVEEKTRSLSTMNETLQERLDTCQRKLEELNVDPVSLDSLPLGPESDSAVLRKEAAGQAAALREELAQMKRKNLEIIASLKSEDVKENQPLAESLGKENI